MTKSLEEIRKEINKLFEEGKRIIIQGEDIDFNRIILENKKVDMLILSHLNKKDKLKQQDSGLNHVLCNLAKKNNITLAIDFKEITNEKDKKSKALILARLEQNISLMKKSKNNIKIINKEGRDNRDLFSFLLTLNMPTDMAKQTIEAN